MKSRRIRLKCGYYKIIAAENLKGLQMSLLAVFGIGVIELIILVVLAAVVGLVIIGVIVAVLMGNQGRKDRRD